MKIQFLLCLVFSILLMSFKLEPLPPTKAYQKEQIRLLKKEAKQLRKQRKAKPKKINSLWEAYLDLVEEIGLIIIGVATFFLLLYGIFALIGTIPNIVSLLYYIFTLGGIAFLLPASIHFFIIGGKLFIKLIAVILCLPCLAAKNFRDWLKDW